MTIERVRSFYYKRPVQPFTIHTTSGQSYTVKHPETMAIDEDDNVVVLLPARGQLAVVDIGLISDITRDFTKPSLPIDN